MSMKNLDRHNRWRNKTVAFRVSPQEDEQLEIFVKLSGLTKQDYITRRLLDKEVVVQGNPRVYKALRDELDAVLDELRRIEAGQGVNDELLDTIQTVSYTHLDVYKRQACAGRSCSPVPQGRSRKAPRAPAA